jgi:replication-associated recombination protein RarA
MVKMLAAGNQASVIVSGPGGLGKTFNVVKTLVASGLKDISHLAEFEVGSNINIKKAFKVVKGYATPKGLYRTLYENRESVLVFDDCDSVLKDPVSLSLLKGALDSYEKRIISWRADMKDEDLPLSFEFKGRVVFISNLPSNALDQAIISRSLAVDLSMTNQQKVDRMRWLLEQSDFMPEVATKIKLEAITLIESIKDKAKELTLRTLVQATNIRQNGGSNWKDLAEYAICG